MAAAAVCLLVLVALLCACGTTVDVFDNDGNNTDDDRITTPDDLSSLLPDVRVGAAMGGAAAHLLVDAPGDTDAAALVANVVRTLMAQHNISAREVYGALLLHADARITDTPYLRSPRGPFLFAITAGPDGVELTDTGTRVVALTRARAAVTLRVTHPSSPLRLRYNGTHIALQSSSACHMGRHRLGDVVIEAIDADDHHRVPMLLAVWARGRARGPPPVVHGAWRALPLHSTQGSITFASPSSSSDEGDGWRAYRALIRARRGRFESFALDLRVGVSVTRRVAADGADGLVMVHAVSVNGLFALAASALQCEWRSVGEVLCMGNTTALADVTLTASAAADAVVRVTVEHLGPETIISSVDDDGDDDSLLRWSAANDRRLLYNLPALSGFVLRSRHEMVAGDGALAVAPFDVALHLHGRPVGAHCSRVSLPLCMAGGMALRTLQTDAQRLWMLPVDAVPIIDGCHHVELMLRSRSVCLERDDRIPFEWSARADDAVVRVTEMLQWMNPCPCVAVDDDHEGTEEID